MVKFQCARVTASMGTREGDDIDNSSVNGRERAVASDGRRFATRGRAGKYTDHHRE
ncbi:hypothetical protein ACLI4Y_04365 [Natrialbaceae archaeon A-CW3]